MGFDITGGLRWHLRACTRRRSHWQSTIACITDWLAQTRPAFKHLLLIGGSAGWMMPSAWLQQFERIDLYDLDPLASWLFRLNHAKALRRTGTELHFHRYDAIRDLDSLLTKYPRASIFFDNVLGQHRFRVDDDELAERELQHFHRQLKGRDWGSIHDLISGPVSGSVRAAQTCRSFQGRQTAQGLTLAGVEAGLAQTALLRVVGATGNWMDHFTSEVFPAGVPLHLMSWHFTPEYCHWLQAGWVAPSVK